MSALPSLDAAEALAAVAPETRAAAAADVARALDLLRSRRGPGADFLGWLDLPETAAAQLPAIAGAAAEIRDRCDALVVVGIGGSYLGARAVIEACGASAGAQDGRPAGVEVCWAGHHLSGPALRALLERLERRSVCVNVISKSGTTTEPALAFRVIRAWMERRYGREEAARRITATTDGARGALRGMADAAGWRSFTIPDDVGGRFSVLTPVGLLPVAAAGIDAAALLDGAARMRARALAAGDENPAAAYAAARTALHRAGALVEILAAFQPELASLVEWWKQLFGESEGKQGRGLFPASVVNTTDLHSMGQYIQDGPRLLFETFLTVRAPGADLVIPEMDGDADGLNYLAGRSFADVNACAFRGTAAAHRAGGAPSIVLQLPALGPADVGALLYCFEVAVALSGYALGVNPFDQPGVEDYKRNMFALLGKPGTEELRRALGG